MTPAAATTHGAHGRAGEGRGPVYGVVGTARMRPLYRNPEPVPSGPFQRAERIMVRPAKSARDERGVVVVWMAIMIVVFLGVAAFSVDIAYWHLVQGRQQRAADAAALAGAVSWPGDS